MARRKNLKVEEIIDEIYEPVNFFTQPGNVDKLKVKFKPKTEKQKELIKTINDKDIVIVNGSPGVGKTLTTMYAALELLRTGRVNQILITKSVQTLDNESLGHLKGELDSKLEPILFSFIHNINKLIGRENYNKLKNFNMLKEFPLGYLRGTSWDNTIIITDEIQNVSIENVRTILTRIGDGSKVILLGDSNQVDNKKLKKNTLETLIKYFKPEESVGVIEFDTDEIVRNPIIKRVETIFKLIEENTNI
jgi:phosphate starvation-inducible PhoH-like protein